MAPTPPPPRPQRRPKEGPSTTGTTGTTGTAPRPGADGPGTRDQGPGATKPPRRAPAAKLQKSLEEALAAPALIYSLAGDQWAAEHITNSAPQVAEAWYKLAQESPAVRRVLEKMTTGSAWGAVIFSTGGMVLPLLAHHGLLPAQIGTLMGGEPNGGPIVPPPPAPQGPPPPTGTPTRAGGGAASNGMTAPVGDGQPPGVVTVAGTGAVIQ